MIRGVLIAVFLLVPRLAWGLGCAGDRPNQVCEFGNPDTAPGSTASRPEKPAGPAAKVASAIQEMQVTLGRARLAGEPFDARRLSTPLVRVNPSGEIQVYVLVEGFEPAHVAQLEAHGLRVELSLPEQGLVQGWLPHAAVDAVAALPFVREIRPPDYRFSNSVGQAATEGEAILRADEARALFGVSGAGVMIGVISDGVDFLNTSIQMGDAPPVLVLRAGDGNEGTAMIEIVHDLAPGSPLAFHGPGTSAEMVAGIHALGAAGARVIVDDLSFFGEPKFQDGMIAQAARAFATGGRVYAASAGNHTKRHYRAAYQRLTGQGFPDSSYAAVHNYGGSPDFGNTVPVGAGCSLSVTLQWSNPWGASGDDFDLFIGRSADSAVLAASDDTQNGTQNPIEFTSWTNSTGGTVTVFVAVAEWSLRTPAGSLIIDYFARESCGEEPQYTTAAQSITGNHGVNEILSTAALGATSPAEAESYSSRGPHNILYPAFESRPVPNISAIDCVQTRTGQLGHFSNPFCGTSAAAPHAAAIAALLIEASPGLDSAGLRNLLFGTAIDLGPPGFDLTYGWGRVDAVNALSAAPLAPVAAIAINAGVFRPGDPLVVGVFAGNPPGNPALALHVGAVMPDGTVVSFAGPNMPGGSTTPARLSGLTPVTTMAGGAVYDVGPFFQGTMPAAGAIPPGLYTMFAALIRPGSLADNGLHGGDVVSASLVQFTYIP
jgi:hypothetical protein